MIKHIFFDLDNTLYSATTRADEKVTMRLHQLIARFFNISYEEAIELRKKNMGNYGTSYEMLHTKFGFNDIELYFSTLHPPEEINDINPDPELKIFLDSIAIPKSVFTNSPTRHAQSFLKKIGIHDCFVNIFDIEFNALKGKPAKEACLRVCQATGVDIADTALVDDSLIYARGYQAAGGRGILIDEFDEHPDCELLRIRSLHELPALLATI